MSVTKCSLQTHLEPITVIRNPRLIFSKSRKGALPKKIKIKIKNTPKQYNTYICVGEVVVHLRAQSYQIILRIY